MIVKKLIVFSAMSGTTNTIVNINDCLYGGNADSTNYNTLRTMQIRHCNHGRHMYIICVVGDLYSNKTRFISKVSDAFVDIPVRSVSYSGYNYYISYIVGLKIN